MHRLLRPSLFHLHVKLILLHFKSIDTHSCNICRMYPFMIRLIPTWLPTRFNQTLGKIRSYTRLSVRFIEFWTVLDRYPLYLHSNICFHNTLLMIDRTVNYLCQRLITRHWFPMFASLGNKLLRGLSVLFSRASGNRTKSCEKKISNDNFRH